MKLPNVHLAHIPRAKIDEYLMSPTHQDGMSKHDFFVLFGFHPNEGEKLVEALKQHALEHEGRNPEVRAIWFMDQGEIIPRLATA